jgi:Flp pilus assembly protein TadD
MDDYYAILGVDRTASAEEIAQKIKQEMRIWPKRAANPDLSRRQEAERRVQLLSEAKATLLEPEARATYDRKLAAEGPRTQSSTAQASSGTDWVDLSRRYLGNNDYNSALYAAREARNSGVATAEVWSLMCRANAGLNKLDEALYEAKQAADLKPTDPQVHIDLGSIHESREEYEPAYRAFEAAHRLDPVEDGPRMAMALIRGEQGRFDEALTSMEALYTNCQDRDQVGRQLAILLVQTAETVPRVQDKTTYVITSPEEITRMRQLLGRARQVTNDPQALSAVVDMEQYVDSCASRKFIFRRMLGDGFFRVGFLPLLLSLCVCSSSTTWSVALLLIGGGLIYLGVQRARPPLWKINYWAHQQSIMMNSR